MVVDDKVVIENKSTAVLPDYTRRKTLNYLRASTLEVGLILHFGPTPKFHRIVQTHRPGGITWTTTLKDPAEPIRPTRVIRVEVFKAA